MTLNTLGNSQSIFGHYLILIIDFSNFYYFQGKKNEATTYFSTATDRSIIGTIMFHF